MPLTWNSAEKGIHLWSSASFPPAIDAVLQIGLDLKVHVSTGAFLFEDVGVTAFHGAIPLIKNNTILNLLAGIAPVEAYHAAILRTLLYQKGSEFVTPYQIRVFDFVQVTAHQLFCCP